MFKNIDTAAEVIKMINREKRRMFQKKSLDELLAMDEDNKLDVKSRNRYNATVERMGSINFGTIYNVLEKEIGSDSMKDLNIDLKIERNFVRDWWASAVRSYILPCLDGDEISYPEGWEAWPNFKVYRNIGNVEELMSVFEMSYVEVVDLIGVVGNNYGAFKTNLNSGFAKMVYIAIMLPLMWATGEYKRFDEIEPLLTRKLIEIIPEPVFIEDDDLEDGYDGECYDEYYDGEYYDEYEECEENDDAVDDDGDLDGNSDDKKPGNE